MTRNPLPRFRADIQVVIDIAAMSDDEAANRLDAIAREIEARLSKSTFARLTGRPEVVLTAVIGDPVRL